MMQQAVVTSKDLKQRQEIPTDFGETLSWNYYIFARGHPIKKWKCSTDFIWQGR